MCQKFKALIIDFLIHKLISSLSPDGFILPMVYLGELFYDAMFELFNFLPTFELLIFLPLWVELFVSNLNKIPLLFVPGVYLIIRAGYFLLVFRVQMNLHIEGIWYALCTREKSCR